MEIQRGSSAITRTTWIYSSTEEIEIVSEDAFRNLTVSITFLLLGLTLGEVGGLVLGTALAFCTYFQNKNEDINNAYVFRETWFEENYWAYKYVDKYYEYENKTNHITTTEREWWT